MKKPGTSAGRAELRALACLYAVTIRLVEDNPDGTWKEVSCFNEGRAQTIHLLFDRRDRCYRSLILATVAEDVVNVIAEGAVSQRDEDFDMCARLGDEDCTDERLSPDLFADLDDSGSQDAASQSDPFDDSNGAGAEEWTYCVESDNRRRGNAIAPEGM